MSSNFSTTRWSVVRNVGLSPQSRREALSDIYTAYWQPICGYLSRLGIQQSDIEDVAQEFFLGVFDSALLEKADPNRGRFRAFLVGALRNHVLHYFRRRATLKRGHGLKPVNSQDNAAVAILEQQQMPADELTRLFDYDWAYAVLENSIQRFQQSGEDYGLATDDLKKLLLGLDQPSQKDEAARLGITITALKARTFRLRRRFRDILRDEVMRTVSSSEDCDAEIAYLAKVLGISSM